MAGESAVVVGHGLVGHRFVEALRARDTTGGGRCACWPRESRAAYDRVRLSAFFDGVGAEELNLHIPDDGVDLRLGEPVTAIDREPPGGDDRRRRVPRTTRWCWPPARTRSCRRSPAPTCPGVFVYRTIDDLEAIRRLRRAARRVGAVIGGGLLGLEAANALRRSASRRTSSSSRRG